MALHRFSSLGLKSRIDARQRANPGHSLQRLPSLTPEIRNHCKQEGQSRAIPAAIPKFTPSIQESLQPRGRGGLQAEPLFFAATKIRIRRRHRCSYDRSRRNHSPLQQRKLESDADIIASTTVAGGPIFVAATKIRIGRCILRFWNKHFSKSDFYIKFSFFKS